MGRTPAAAVVNCTRRRPQKNGGRHSPTPMSTPTTARQPDGRQAAPPAGHGLLAGCSEVTRCQRTWLRRRRARMFHVKPRQQDTEWRRFRRYGHDENLPLGRIRQFVVAEPEDEAGQQYAAAVAGGDGAELLEPVKRRSTGRAAGLNGDADGPLAAAAPRARPTALDAMRPVAKRAAFCCGACRGSASKAGGRPSRPPMRARLARWSRDRGDAATAQPGMDAADGVALAPGSASGRVRGRLPPGRTLANGPSPTRTRSSR